MSPVFVVALALINPRTCSFRQIRGFFKSISNKQLVFLLVGTGRSPCAFRWPWASAVRRCTPGTCSFRQIRGFFKSISNKQLVFLLVGTGRSPCAFRWPWASAVRRCTPGRENCQAGSVFRTFPPHSISQNGHDWSGEVVIFDKSRFLKRKILFHILLLWSSCVCQNLRLAEFYSLCILHIAQNPVPYPSSMVKLCMPKLAFSRIL